jgi:hypothetical protein
VYTYKYIQVLRNIRHRAGTRVSVVRLFGGSAAQLFGCSAVRRFGCSAVRRFGGSAVRLFGGSVVSLFGCSAVLVADNNRGCLLSNVVTHGQQAGSLCIFKSFLESSIYIFLLLVK